MQQAGNSVSAHVSSCISQAHVVWRDMIHPRTHNSRLAAGSVRVKAQRRLQHLQRLFQHRAHERHRRRRAQQRVQGRLHCCLRAEEHAQCK